MLGRFASDGAVTFEYALDGGAPQVEAADPFAGPLAPWGDDTVESRIGGWIRRNAILRGEHSLADVRRAFG